MSVCCLSSCGVGFAYPLHCARSGNDALSRSLYMFARGWPRGRTLEFINYALNPQRGHRLVDLHLLLQGEHECNLASAGRDWLPFDMAAALINDSEPASRIVPNLIDIATLLYYPRDRLVDEMAVKDAVVVA